MSVSCVCWCVGLCVIGGIWFGLGVLVMLCFWWVCLCVGWSVVVLCVGGVVGWCFGIVWIGLVVVVVVLLFSCGLFFLGFLLLEFVLLCCCGLWFVFCFYFFVGVGLLLCCFLVCSGVVVFSACWDFLGGLGLGSFVAV